MNCIERLLRGALAKNLHFDLTMPSADAVSLEIAKIEGNHLGSAQRFCSNNDGRVCEIHGVIAVLFHQFEWGLAPLLSEH